MKNKISFLAVLVAALFVTLSGCKKDTTEADKNTALQAEIAASNQLLDSLRLVVNSNAIEQAYRDSANALNSSYNAGTIFYTVQVVAGENLTGKTDGLSGADVYANQNGVITKVTTDGSGQAAFRLRTGNVAVSVVSNNHTTVNYVVELDQNNNNGGQTYASTIIPVFPLSGNGTATITGVVNAELDYTNTNTEKAPDGTRINAYIEQSQLLGYLTHSLPGKLAKVTYESSTFTTNVQGGRYTLTVPASARGLNITVTPVDFDYIVAISANSQQRQVFKKFPFNVNVTSNGNVYADFSY